MFAYQMRKYWLADVGPEHREPEHELAHVVQVLIGEAPLSLPKKRRAMKIAVSKARAETRLPAKKYTPYIVLNQWKSSVMIQWNAANMVAKA